MGANSGATCPWNCMAESDCTGSGCEWTSDTCTYGTVSLTGSSAVNTCKGCAEGVNLCDHLMILNICFALIIICSIVASAMTCCIACCGKDELDGGGADEDSGAQKLER